jgi:protein-tyrosine kinase
MGGWRARLSPNRRFFSDVDDDNRTHLIERAAARLRPLPAAGIPLPNRRSVAEKLAPEWSATTLGPTAIPTDTAAAPRQRISSTALAEAGLICWKEPNNRAAEEFRIIQEKILRQSFGKNGAAANNRDNLVMVTSALKGEGKSFCALNLAGEVARQGDRKVLLVDADPKPHGLAQIAGGSGERGLRDLATGKRLDVAAITIPTETGSLEFLPFGINGEGNAELFASRRMAEVIEEIGRYYADRLIIFDAPPCLSSSTPHTLAAVVGQVVLVVASGSTQQGDVEAALDLLQACPHISLLLNKIPMWMAQSFGSYSYAAVGS